MILILLPNPALDKTVVLPGFEVGATYRAASVLTLAGGKGFNFARALHLLGEESLVLTTLGGHGGQYLVELATGDGLACDGPVTRTELRTCLTVIDPEAGNRLTEIYEQGASLEMADWEKLLMLVRTNIGRASYLAVCGSFPPGFPTQNLVDLLALAREAGVPVLLDSYGPQTEGVLAQEPDLLKINQHEAGELTGKRIIAPEEALAAAVNLRGRGVRQVVITLGSQGVVGLDAEGSTFGWAAPRVAAISPIGSGDCLFAGVVAGLRQGQTLCEATRLGVAAGAANTLQIGAGRLERVEVERLIPEVPELT